MQNIKREIPSPSFPPLLSPALQYNSFTEQHTEQTYQNNEAHVDMGLNSILVGDHDGSDIPNVDHSMQSMKQLYMAESNGQPMEGVVVTPDAQGKKPDAQLMPDSNYKCAVCEEVLPSKTSLQQHLMVHSNRYFKCPHCNRLFFRQVDCDRHMVVHGKRESEKCQFCETTYVSKVGKNRHLKKRHPEEWKKMCQQTISLEQQGLKCPFCNNVFDSVAKMKRHMRYHKQKLQITKCFICYMEFGSTQELEEHVKSHSITLNLECMNCHKKFDNHIKLEHHKCESKEHQCAECALWFESFEVLREHCKNAGHTEGMDVDIGEGALESTGDLESAGDSSLNSLQISNVVSCASDNVFAENENPEASLQISNVVSYHGETANNDDSFSVTQAEKDLEMEGEEDGEKNDQSGESNDLEITNETIYDLQDQYDGPADDLPYGCSMCTKAFDKRTSLLKHLKTHLQKGRYRCEKCPYTSSRGANLVRHMKVHAYERGTAEERKKAMRMRQFQNQPILPREPKQIPPTLCHCLTCNADFTSYDDLQEHMKEHKEKNEHICHLCSRVFESEDMLTMHKYSMKSACRIGCDYCGLVLPNRANLWNHRKTHVKDNRCYSCYLEGCNKKFTCTRTLKKHIVAFHVTKVNMHLFDFKIFECMICGKLHSLKSDLDFHLRSHTQGKPFKCPTCGVGCSDKHNLRKHMYTHMSIRPFPCEICVKSFSTRNLLVKHYKEIHAYNPDAMPGSPSNLQTITIDEEDTEDSDEEVDIEGTDDTFQFSPGVTAEFNEGEGLPDQLDLVGIDAVDDAPQGDMFVVGNSTFTDTSGITEGENSMESSMLDQDNSRSSASIGPDKDD